MSGRIRALILAGVAAVGLVGLAAEAQASAFGLRDQSAEAQGEAYAGAASGSGGVSSMFWNPAVITMRPGLTAEGNLTFIGLHADIRPVEGTNPAFAPLGRSGDIGQGAVIPSTAASYQIGDRLWLGLQVGAPFGLITKPNDVWAGEVYGRSSRIFSFAINPVLAYQATDWLSIAAGPSIEYFRLTLRQAVPLPGLLPANYPSGFIKGESWGVGFTAGVTIIPWDGTVLGLGYRSSVHHEIDGSIGVPIPQLAALGGPIKADLNTPDKLSLGLTQAITPTTRVNVGFEWDAWSRLGTVGIVSKTLGVPVNVLPLNFHDGYIYEIGGEYDWSPALTLRAGFSYEQSPIDTGNRTVRLPDNDRYGLSAGLTYRWSDRLALHAAYTHLFLDRSRVFAGPGYNYNTANIALAGLVDASADVVSVGFRYAFGAPPAPMPAPLVRKN